MRKIDLQKQLELAGVEIARLLKLSLEQRETLNSAMETLRRQQVTIRRQDETIKNQGEAIQAAIDQIVEPNQPGKQYLH